jgi:hypothetical protein
MSTAPPPITASARPERGARGWWESTQVWAGLSIASMWLAVLVTGIFGPDFTSTSNNASTNTSSLTIPSVVFVALGALLATVSVAHAAFRRPE